MSKESQKKPPKKQKKERGLRSLSRPEDQGMLSTDEQTLAETFWNHYIKAQGNNLTKLQQSDILATTASASSLAVAKLGGKIVA